jgi:opacity protein-like surface antigen
MNQSSLQVARGLAAVALLFTATTASLHGQTNDQARLTLGIAAGFIGSTSLWDVPNQPVYLASSPDPDIFHLHRELKSDITVSGHATYFGSPHLGVTGEFTYLGLGSSDACDVVHDNGNVELAAVCSALKGTLGSASTTVIQAGLVYRPLSRAALQPYAKLMGGLAFTPSSSIALQSIYGAIADTELIVTIYKDDNWKSIRTSWTAALGISTAPSQGYQLRVEARETWLPLSAVTGPTSGQGYVPPSKTVIKGIPSIMVAFDIVLAKQRGRRY